MQYGIKQKSVSLLVYDLYNLMTIPNGCIISFALSNLSRLIVPLWPIRS